MVFKTVYRCLCLQFIQEIFQNIPCIGMNLLNFREKKVLQSFSKKPLHYNSEFSLYVKYYLVSTYCCITKNIISFIAYQSWYFNLVSCCCRTVTNLHEALQVLVIIWLYTKLVLHTKCIHYTDKLNRIINKIKQININCPVHYIFGL